MTEDGEQPGALKAPIVKDRSFEIITNLITRWQDLAGDRSGHWPVLTALWCDRTRQARAVVAWPGHLTAARPDLRVKVARQGVG